MQGHTQKSSKLRNKGSEDAATMHLREGLVHSFLPFENLKERNIGGSRPAKLIIDQVQMFAQKLACLLRHLAAVLLHVVENTDEISGVGLENIRFCDGDLPFKNANPVAQVPAESIFSAKKGSRGFH